MALLLIVYLLGKSNRIKERGIIICIYMILTILYGSVLIQKIKGYNLSTPEVLVTLQYRVFGAISFCSLPNSIQYLLSSFVKSPNIVLATE